MRGPELGALLFSAAAEGRLRTLRARTDAQNTLVIERLGPPPAPPRKTPSGAGGRFGPARAPGSGVLEAQRGVAAAAGRETIAGSREARDWRARWESYLIELAALESSVASALGFASDGDLPPLEQRYNNLLSGWDLIEVQFKNRALGDVIARTEQQIATARATGAPLPPPEPVAAARAHIESQVLPPPAQPVVIPVVLPPLPPQASWWGAIPWWVKAFGVTGVLAWLAARAR